MAAAIPGNSGATLEYLTIVDEVRNKGEIKEDNGFLQISRNRTLSSE